MERNISQYEKVREWNKELSDVLIPNDVILTLYVLLGICGNSVVLYVYKVRLTGKMTDRYFIPFLAITDLSASTVCGTFGIALNMMQASFTNTHLCKAWWFFAAFTTYMSIQLLLIIAVQRYLKVVKPVGRQMDVRINRIAMLGALCLAVIIAGPTTALYGSVPFPNKNGTIIGMRCSKIKGENKTGSILYGSVIGLIAITIVASLIGIYLRVGWTIFRHMKFNRNFSNAAIDEDMSSEKSTKGTSIDEIDQGKPDVTKQDIANGKNKQLDHKSSVFTTQTIHSDNVSQNKTGNPKKPRKTDHHDKINKKIMHKFTLMFMLITFIFLVCYIPKVLIMLVEALNPKFWEEFSDTDRAAMLFVYRMYIINNVSNPFVYAFLDVKFRNELKQMCRWHRKY